MNLISSLVAKYAKFDVQIFLTAWWATLPGPYAEVNSKTLWLKMDSISETISQITITTIPQLICPLLLESLSPLLSPI